MSEQPPRPTLNKNHNAYICNKCGYIFKGRTELRDHAMRLRPCGIITDNDLVEDIKRILGASANQFDIAMNETPPDMRTIKKCLDKLDRCLVFLARDAANTSLVEIARSQVCEMRKRVSMI